MSMRQMNAREIIDWYDGIVLAIVSTSWCPGVFLASLLSWDQVRQQRLYALVPLSEINVADIKLLLDRWDELMSHLRNLRNIIRGDAALALLDEASGTVIANATIPIADVRGALFGQVEDALAAERRQWLDFVMAH